MKNKVKENEKIFKEGDKYWAEQFNGLPDNVQHVAWAKNRCMQIQYLEQEKQRLKDSHRLSLSRINAEIKREKAYYNSEFNVKEEL